MAGAVGWAAFAEVGPGQVTSVERDSRRGIKVRLRNGQGVVLDASLGVVRVDDEDPRDE